MCAGGSRIPNLQTEINYLFKSYGIFSDFVVPMWSPWSPRHLRCPHVIPVIPTSSPCHPHIVPIAPRRSPYGLHGCGLCGLHPMSSLLSPLSHVIPVILMSSPCCLEGPHIIPHPPDTTPPTLGGVGVPESLKMQLDLN